MLLQFVFGATLKLTGSHSNIEWAETSGTKARLTATCSNDATTITYIAALRGDVQEFMTGYPGPGGANLMAPWLMMSTLPLCTGKRLSEPCVAIDPFRPAMFYCHFSTSEKFSTNITQGPYFAKLTNLTQRGSTLPVSMTAVSEPHPIVACPYPTAKKWVDLGGEMSQGEVHIQLTHAGVPIAFDDTTLSVIRFDTRSPDSPPPPLPPTTPPPPKVRQYFIAPENTWPVAEAYCVANGGHLASIHSDAENAAAITYMQAHTSSSYPWIGGKDMQSSPVWSDGSARDYNPGVCSSGASPCDHGIDNPYAHFYRNGHWGTHCSTCKAQGVCQRWV